MGGKVAGTRNMAGSAQYVRKETERLTRAIWRDIVGRSVYGGKADAWLAHDMHIKKNRFRLR